jgi:hypothetical protein
MKPPAYILLFYLVTATTISFCQKSPNHFINLSDTNFQVGDYYYLPKNPSPFGSCWPSNNDTTNVFLSPIVTFLKQNPKIKAVEFCVHTDSRPIPLTNDTLTSRIANHIKEFLVERGIEPSRIIAKGCADHFPRLVLKDTVVTFPNHSGFANCLNTSLFVKKNTVIDDKFINALKDKCEKELAYYLNRRTVMTILKIE